MAANSVRLPSNSLCSLVFSSSNCCFSALKLSKSVCSWSMPAQFARPYFDIRDLFRFFDLVLDNKSSSPWFLEQTKIPQWSRLSCLWLFSCSHLWVVSLCLCSVEASSRCQWADAILAKAGYKNCQNNMIAMLGMIDRANRLGWMQGEGSPCNNNPLDTVTAILLLDPRLQWGHWLQLRWSVNQLLIAAKTTIQWILELMQLSKPWRTVTTM